MINKIHISQERRIFPDEKIMGVVGEHNAEVLQFILPEKVNDKSVTELDAVFVLVNDLGTQRVAIPKSGEIALTEAMTGKDKAFFWVEISDGDELLWKSFDYLAEFHQNPNGSVDLIAQAVAKAQTAYKADLSNSLNELTGKYFDGKTWVELNDEVKKLPVKTEQEINDLTNFEKLNGIFESMTAPPNLLVGNTVPELYRLPFINTKKVRWKDSDRISSNIVECGFDVSSSATVDTAGVWQTIFSGNNGGIFSSASNLKKLTLTGLGIFKNLHNFLDGNKSTGANGIQELYLYGAKPTNMRRAFYDKSFLRVVGGDPLDLSEATSSTWSEPVFTGAASLRYIRFKPKSIQVPLNFTGCVELHHHEETGLNDSGTLISILNGFRDFVNISQTPTLQVTFPKSLQTYITSLCRVVYDESTGLWQEAADGAEGAKHLSSAFTSTIDGGKGVILAWA